MDTATRVQILDETDCISHSTNTLGKGMNPIILPPAMGKFLCDYVRNGYCKCVMTSTAESKPVFSKSSTAHEK